MQEYRNRSPSKQQKKEQMSTPVPTPPTTSTPSTVTTKSVSDGVNGITSLDYKDMLCLISLLPCLLVSIAAISQLDSHGDNKGPTKTVAIVLCAVGIVFSIPASILATARRLKTLGRLAFSAVVSLLAIYIFVPSDQSSDMAAMMFVPVAIVALLCLFVPLPT